MASQGPGGEGIGGHLHGARLCPPGSLSTRAHPASLSTRRANRGWRHTCGNRLRSFPSARSLASSEIRGSGLSGRPDPKSMLTGRPGRRFSQSHDVPIEHVLIGQARKHMRDETCSPPVRPHAEGALCVRLLRPRPTLRNRVRRRPKRMESDRANPPGTVGNRLFPAHPPGAPPKIPSNLLPPPV